ncbi:MAG: hypothetical protein M3O34_07420 [Chloroflexota bacterium]|nr:hypothetical protein [Chloroflexota bacterium]
MGTSHALLSATARGLVGLGFSSGEVGRLLDLKDRYARGELHELTREVQRLRFVRWLVEQGRLNEGTP